MDHNSRKNILALSLLALLAACAPGKTTLPSSDSNSGQATTPPIDNQPPAEPSLPADPATPVGASDVLPFPETREKFKSAWANSLTTIVIDAYEGNSIDWVKMGSDRRVAGVIHRASIGKQLDSKYRDRKKIAQERGYLWAAYHLAKAGDPIGQAKFFLEAVGNDPSTMLMLDLEDVTSPSLMSVSDAVKFMEYVYGATRRIPVVYANHSTTKELNHAIANNPIFKSSKLWYARFRPDIPDFPKGLWSTYFLWQFSSEINCTATGRCLYNVPGTSFDIDVNVFYGSRDALAALWN